MGELMETARKSISSGEGQYVTLVIPHAVKIKNGVHLLESIIRGMHVIQDSAKLVIGCLVENLKRQPNDIQQETDKTTMDTEIKSQYVSEPKKYKKKKRKKFITKL